MADLEPGPLQDRLFVLHESLGITLLALMVLRLANRLRGAPVPDASLGRAERIAAGVVHHVLYLMLFLTPLSAGWRCRPMGWARHSLALDICRHC